MEDTLNLSVLRRHNPHIQNILSIAPYTVIYMFSLVSQTWEKIGIEGTLFVCSLRDESSSIESLERYIVIVLNRKSLDNFELELTREEDVEITPEYVILQGTRQAQQIETTGDVETAEAEAEQEHQRLIYGLWIFAEPPPSSTSQMRDVNARLIQDCAARAEASRKAAGSFSKRQNNGHDNLTSGRSVLGGLDHEVAAEKMSRGSSAAGRQGLDFGRQEAQHWDEWQGLRESGEGQNGRENVTGGGGGGDVLDDLFRRARHAQRSEAAG